MSDKKKKSREVDLTKVIYDLSGKHPIKTRGEPTDDEPQGAIRDMVLKDALIQGLTMTDPQTKATTAVEKIRQYSLAQEIYKADSMELKAEDVVLLTKLVNQAFPSPLIVGRVVEEIDPPSMEV